MISPECAWQTALTSAATQIRIPPWLLTAAILLGILGCDGSDDVAVVPLSEAMQRTADAGSARVNLVMFQRYVVSEAIRDGERNRGNLQAFQGLESPTLFQGEGLVDFSREALTLLISTGENERRVTGIDNEPIVEYVVLGNLNLRREVTREHQWGEWEEASNEGESAIAPIANLISATGVGRPNW